MASFCNCRIQMLYAFLGTPMTKDSFGFESNSRYGTGPVEYSSSLLDQDGCRHDVASFNVIFQYPRNLSITSIRLAQQQQ